MKRKKQVHNALPKLLLNSEDNHEKKQVHNALPKLLPNSEDNHEKKETGTQWLTYITIEF